VRRPRSLYARLVIGTVVWVVTVFVIVFFSGAALAHAHPGWGVQIHNAFLLIGSITLVTAGVSVIRRGLSPFVMLRERLGDVRSGRTSRLEGEYPTEVEPLVQDLNTLLAERERRVAQAVAKAGDLAHGLKTPLAILMQEIEHSRSAVRSEFADTLREQVERMRRQIDSHLAQARANAGGAMGARASVGDATEALVRAMRRLHVERGLSFTSDVANDVCVRVPAEDLEEMLGNLLDNACKWARSHVNVSADVSGTRVTIDVDDDGAGLEPALRETVLQRGVRADEKAPGSGLGLAIVRDLAEAYGGTIALEKSPDGGLRARLTLPVPRP
jgi:signal transduction histidine kinase